MKAFALTAALTVAALTGAASTASADHWRHGGGHGHWRGGYERYDGFPGRGYGYDWRRRWVERYAYPRRPYGYYGTVVSGGSPATVLTRPMATTATDWSRSPSRWGQR
jgi:hypothetical protein